MASRLYDGLTGYDVRVPSGADFDATDHEYLDMAMTGAVTDHHREFFLRVGCACHCAAISRSPRR